MTKIFVGTPCFEYKVNANYVNSLLEFKEQGIDFVPYFLHDSLITRVRNELITQFYENQKDFTQTNMEFWKTLNSSNKSLVKTLLSYK